MAHRLAALDGAGELNGATEQQQFLGQGGLAGIRMRDDRKGAPAVELFFQLGHDLGVPGLALGKTR